MRIFAAAPALLLVVAGAFAVSRDAAAQSTGTTTADLAGRVVDGRGQPLPGVTVTATNKANGAARASVSKVDGDYAIPLLAPGLYDVRADLGDASVAVAGDVRLALGGTTRLDVTLNVPPRKTAEIEVTS